MYGKLIDNELQYAPTHYQLEDGSVIVGFNNSVELMKQYGYKEIIDNMPEYDQDTHYFVVSGYTEEAEKIIVNYTIKEIPPKPPTLEDRLIVLESQQKEIESFLNQEINK